MTVRLIFLSLENLMKTRIVQTSNIKISTTPCPLPILPIYRVIHLKKKTNFLYSNSYLFKINFVLSFKVLIVFIVSELHVFWCCWGKIRDDDKILHFNTQFNTSLFLFLWSLCLHLTMVSV